MEIIAHRGLWEKPYEKNSFEALIKSLDQGFGIETDIRDFKNKIVISHDPASGKEIEFKKLLTDYENKKYSNFLALNIKSDGIQQEAYSLIKKFKIKRYAFFDQSVPELFHCHSLGSNYLSRLSDIEPHMHLYDNSYGVWVDSFEEFRTDVQIFDKILGDGKILCFVSPELHGRPYMEVWKWIHNFNKIRNARVAICTDHPLEAEVFFK